MSRRSRGSGSTPRPCGVALPGLSFLLINRLGCRSERRPKRCFKAASSLPRKSALSARSRDSSVSSWRTRACNVGTSSGKGLSGDRQVASMPDQTPSSRASSAIFCGFGGKAFEASDLGQVDAVEDHLELAGSQFQAGVLRGPLGEVVASGFKPLTPQAQAVPAPVKDLESVCVAIAEDEQMARKRVGFQAVLHKKKEAVEAQAHVDGSRTIPELDGG